ncbi:MAG: class I tRNA ligase family protein [Minisyncoccia bacterium]
MAKDPFSHGDIERKWQERWKLNDTYRTSDDPDKEKKYVLDMFPYPSGEGLHVGHPKGYIATDIYSRHMRMRGFSVLHPMGWDAFGLPAENYALKNKTHPRKAVEDNIANFKAQLAHIGFDYDWSREINTTDPAYYHWTQWIFLKMLEQGLAFQSNEPINWCPSCMTGLANEDLDGAVCERCGTPVVKKNLPQWVLKITDYADRMLADLDLLDWPEHIKEAQRNWIGRSEGAEIDFAFTDIADKATVFTTRPDTIFGATYLVLAPEHPLVSKLIEYGLVKNKDAVREYAKSVALKTEIDRSAEGKEKTGVILEGVSAINPATKEGIPVYIADYVLASYGTGAVMAVPAHDERDFEFAEKFKLPIRQVVVPCESDTLNPPRPEFTEVKRDTVVVHLRDNSTGKYALLKWHGTLEGITTAIMGGIEAGQTPEDAALAEIREEAALEGVRIVRKLRWITAARYCASHKKENRCAHAHALLAEIDSTAQQGIIPADEQAKHTLYWVDEKDVEEQLTPAHQKGMWRLLHKEESLTGHGYLIHSGSFDGRNSESAKWDITEAVGGRRVVRYKLRDWVFSRQRYWGEPIPVIHCPTDGVVAVPYEDLPLLLPEVESYEPTGTGESPLAAIDDWVNTTCPKCGGPAKRETNTMPQWAGSSWYYLRFMDPHNAEQLVSAKKEKYWAPVDVYVGGDHAVRHLIYARFWHKFLYDISVVSTPEPFARLEFLGFILAEDGRKMSKRFGNVINPDDVVAEYGADAFRIYEMFMGPFENTTSWSTASIAGTARFVERVWQTQERVTEHDVPALNQILHETIRKVGNDIEAFKFNTAVSQMMILLNAIDKQGSIGKEQWKIFLRLLAPFAPHITDELWELVGETLSIHLASWPVHDESLLVAEEMEVVVQVNGKRRGTARLAPDASEMDAVAAAKDLPAVISALSGKEPNRVVYVAGRIINLVV